MESQAFFETRRVAFEDLALRERAFDLHAHRLPRPAVDASEPRWIVGGGPTDLHAQQSLVEALFAEARLAAVGAGVAQADDDQRTAVEKWCDLLVQSHSPFWHDVGTIESLARASAEKCRQLASETYRPPERMGDRINRLRLESGMSVEDLAAAMELAKTSVIAHTQNRSTPRPEALSRYAEVFSSRLERQVSVADLRGEA